MPAIAIRQLHSLAQIAQFVSTEEERQALRRQAEMILRASNEAIPEGLDRDDVRRRYDQVIEASAVADRGTATKAT
jgi:uncharacterized membrane protein